MKMIDNGMYVDIFEYSFLVEIAEFIDDGK